MNPPSTSNILGFGQRVLDSFGAKKKKSLVLWVFKGFFQKNFPQLSFPWENVFFWDLSSSCMILCPSGKKTFDSREKGKKTQKTKKNNVDFLQWI